MFLVTGGTANGQLARDGDKECIAVAHPDTSSAVACGQRIFDTAVRCRLRPRSQRRSLSPIHHTIPSKRRIRIRLLRHNGARTRDRFLQVVPGRHTPLGSFNLCFCHISSLTVQKRPPCWHGAQPQLEYTGNRSRMRCFTECFSVIDAAEARNRVECPPGIGDFYNGHAVALNEQAIRKPALVRKFVDSTTPVRASDVHPSVGEWSFRRRSI